MSEDGFVCMYFDIAFEANICHRAKINWAEARQIGHATFLCPLVFLHETNQHMQQFY